MLTYHPEELHKLRSTSTCLLNSLPKEILEDICINPELNINSDLNNKDSEKKQRKRGRKGGVRARAKRNGQRLSLPSIIFGNVRSLNNKVDELSARVRFQSDYRNASVLCFTETWLNPDVPDSLVSPDGFHPVRSDRTLNSGKKVGGGLCLFVNEKWCHTNNIILKEKTCLPQVETLVVQCRPYYLPREIPCIVFIVVYLPAGPDPESTLHIDNLVTKCQREKPNSAIIVLGDFNQEDFKVQNFKQYVTCNTRENKKIDLCFSNIKNAFKCYKKEPLGLSDHDIVSLLPSYVTKFKSEKTIKKSVKIWSENSVEALQACFECTDWNAFKDACKTQDELVDTVSEYILFCENNLIEQKIIKIYPNNKPWITKNLKEKLVQKRKYLASHDRLQLKILQKELNEEIKVCKENYKNKLEQHFTKNNAREAWKGLNTITGKGVKKSTPAVSDVNQFADDLNKFYARFDSEDAASEVEKLKNSLCESNNKQDLVINVSEVEKQFKTLNSRKSAGPDKISPILLKLCYKQLSGVYCDLFNSCVNEYIPSLWKTATIVPVPKKPTPKDLNDYRPISLTSVPFKCLERIILNSLKCEVEDKLDPFQFAYRSKKSTEDAVLYVVHSILEHLEHKNTSARALFIDFSSAFNTIKPSILIEKLKKLSCSYKIYSFVLDFLSNRIQQVKVKNIFSKPITINTGSPQGCVLSAFLFTLYTHDLSAKYDNCRVVKYADDTVIIGLINGNDISNYKLQIEHTVLWCNEQNLFLNVTKTKELIFDFRKNPAHEQIQINGDDVEECESFKYLGVIIDKNLNWSEHARYVISKCRQRLYLLYVLKSFNVNSKILYLFYLSTIASIINYNFIVWWNSTNQHNKMLINSIYKKAKKAINSEMFEVPDGQTNYKNLVCKKTNKLLKDENSLYSEYFQTMRSGKRLRLIKCKTLRYQNSFVPSSVHILNSTLLR